MRGWGATAAAMLLLTSIGDAQAPVDGAPHGMSRAAGMPLRDGALAPGMLTVRVVRGGFSNNVPDQPVRLEQGGAVTIVRTGPDGRAQFAHLPVGAMVRVSALVDGETLASDAFAMPAESGIRVLLIAGGGDASASGVFGGPSGDGLVSGDPALPAPVIPARTASDSTDSTVLIIRVVLIAATLVGFAVVTSRLRQRRH